MRLIREAVAAAQSGADGQRVARELSQRVADLSALLAAAREKAVVREQPFTSRAPVVGGLIVLARRAWNWMSTVWWVRPLTAQQNAFNQELLAALDETLDALRASALLLGHLAAADALRRAEAQALREEVQALREAVAGAATSRQDR
jgi:hypothetical protein